MPPKLEKYDPAKLNAQLQQLTKASEKVNELTDELNRHVSDIEANVNRLTLGISVDVVVSTSSDEEGFRTQEIIIAYGKVGNRWGIFIKKEVEDLRFPDPDNIDIDVWPFHEAPRDLRLKSVGYIPNLLDALIKKSEEIQSQIQDAVAFTSDLATNIVKASAQGGK